MCAEANVEPIRRRRVQVTRRPATDVKVVVLGDANVGKSALVRAFCGKGPFSAVYDPTVGAEFQARGLDIRGREFRVNIFDLSGDDRYGDVRNEFYKDAHAALLVFDATSRRSFQNLELWLAEVSKFGQGGMPCAVAAAKVEATPRAVSEQDGRNWASSKKMEYFEVSASLGLNIDTPFTELARKCG